MSETTPLPNVSVSASSSGISPAQPSAQTHRRGPISSGHQIGSRVVQMAADGALSVPITRRHTFDELPQALRLVGEERSRGKFAITI